MDPPEFICPSDEPRRLAASHAGTKGETASCRFPWFGASMPDTNCHRHATLHAGYRRTAAERNDHRLRHDLALLQLGYGHELYRHAVLASRQLGKDVVQYFAFVRAQLVDQMTSDCRLKSGAGCFDHGLPCWQQPHFHTVAHLHAFHLRARLHASQKV